MNKEIDPSIKSYSNEELIAIANVPNELPETVIEEAKAELLARGITEIEQNKQLRDWKKQEKLAEQKEADARAIESYGLYDLFWLAIRWPLTLLTDWSLRKEGYIRKYDERLYAIGAGMVIWVILAFYANYEFDRLERARQNEINQIDIYEWELENYTIEEIAESRKKAIEKVIRLVKENELKEIPTYVIVQSDTLANDEVTALRTLDLLNIRDVVLQESVKKNAYMWVEIKLVKP